MWSMRIEWASEEELSWGGGVLGMYQFPNESLLSHPHRERIFISEDSTLQLREVEGIRTHRTMQV